MGTHRRSRYVMNDTFPTAALFGRGRCWVLPSGNRLGRCNVLPGKGVGKVLGLSGHGNSKDRAIS